MRWSAVSLGLLAGLVTAAVASAESAERVRVVTDQTAGTWTVLIDGRAVLQADAKGVWAAGLRTPGDVSYSGVLTEGVVDDGPR